MEWWHVYLFTRLDSLNFLLCICFAIGLVVTIILGIAWFAENDVDDDAAVKYKGLFMRGVAAILTVAAVSVLIPTQKEAAAIYLLPKLAHSDFAKEAQQIPTDAAKVMRLKLESWIADMDPQKAVKK